MIEKNFGQRTIVYDKLTLKLQTGSYMSIFEGVEVFRQSSRRLLMRTPDYMNVGSRQGFQIALVFQFCCFKTNMSRVMLDKFCVILENSKETNA